MFYYIEGQVAHLDTGIAVLDVGGVGYALNVSLNTLSRLEMGKKARLYVVESIREDAFDLYGFYDLTEKRSYELLVGVSGVGPKAAQSILSAVTPEGLAMAVVSENEKALTQAQGIGKRIAQRIILELKDKIAKENIGMPAASGGFVTAGPGGAKSAADAVAALAVLGYSQNEISAALSGINTEGLTTEEIIRLVLKNSVK